MVRGESATKAVYVLVPVRTARNRACLQPSIQWECGRSLEMLVSTSVCSVDEMSTG